jgi:HSP20 family protein
MTLVKKTNGGFVPFRSILNDFFSADDLLFDHMVDRDFIPAVNISETDKSFEVDFVVPGMKKNDFKIKVENNQLIVSAEKKEEKQEKDKNYTRQEYNYSSFMRSFTLPENAKIDDIKAHYEDGILKLSVAKKVISASKAKEIAIL